RSQRFLGGGRLGTQVTAASPAPRDQWWFANGRKGSERTDRYSIYNPTDDDVEVDTIFLGIPEGIEADRMPVRAVGSPSCRMDATPWGPPRWPSRRLSSSGRPRRSSTTWSRRRSSPAPR